MKKAAASSRRCQSGVAAIEFALLFSVFFALIYALATFGAVFYTQQAVSRSAEDGARAIKLLGGGAVATNDIQIAGVVRNSLAASLIAPVSSNLTQAGRKTWVSDPLNVSVLVDPGCAGVAGCVKVTVHYQYGRNPILTAIPLISWVPATLSASAIAKT